MTSSVARVASIVTQPAGSSLVSEARTGATTLHVQDAADFNEDGGQVLLPDRSTVLSYVSADQELNTLTLAAPLASDLWVVGSVDGDVDCPVLVYPLSNEMKAVVVFEDDTDDGVQAVVPLELQGYFTEGIRDGYERESVVVDDDSGYWKVASVADEKRILGSAVDPVGLPNPIPNEPPELSPKPVVYGTADSLLVVVSPGTVAPGTTIDYHISQADSFNVDESTLVMSTKQTMVTLPRGPEGLSLALGTTYYVRIVARNEAGAAVQSEQTPGSLDPTVVSQIIAAEIVAGFVLAGQIKVGQMSWDPENGLLIPSATGTTQLSADGSGNTFAGQGTFDALMVLGNLTIRGTNNEVSKGASVTLETGVKAPKVAPTLSSEYVVNPSHEGYNPRSFSVYGGGGPNRFLKTESLFAGAVSIVQRDAVTGEYTLVEIESLSDKRPEITSALGGAVLTGSGSSAVLTALCQTDEAWGNTYAARWYLYQFTYNPTASPGSRFTFLRRAEFMNPSNTGYFSGASPYDPTLSVGPDGTSLRVCQSASNGNVALFDFTSTLSTITPKYLRVTSGGAFFAIKRNARAVISTQADLATDTIWVGFEGDAKAYAFDSLGVRRPVDDFPLDSTRLKGMCWDGERFLAFNGDTVVHHSKIKDTNLTTLPIQVGQTWRLANGVSPRYAGAETSLSPNRSMSNLSKRAWLRITSAVEIPDDTSDPTDANALSFYIARKSGTPASSEYSRAATPSPGVKTALLDTLPTSGGAPPSTTSGFAVGAPARIRSAAEDAAGPLVDLRGDGSGRVGWMSWNSDGGGLPAIIGGKSSAQTIAANTTTCVKLNVARQGPMGGMVLSGGTVTVPITGWYQVSGNVTFSAATSSARRTLWVAKGTAPGSLSTFMHSTSVASAQNTANLTTLACSGLVWCSAGEVVGLAVHTASAWSIDISQPYQNSLSVHFVGR